jgi:ketopantoate reductase
MVAGMSELEIEEEAPRRVVIGAGRIGTLFKKAANCAVVTRQRGWSVLDEPAGDPVAVCVRNDDLAGVLSRTPAHRRPDLVFVQNGMIDPWLEDHGLEGNTRGMLFFAASERGGPVDPGGISRFTGAHANAMALWLESLGLRAEVVGRRSFSAVMLEKLIWNASFGLLCERFGLDVGGVLGDHDAELSALARELAAVGRAALDIDLEPAALLDNLRAYAGSIPRNRAGIKEWRWRNGWFIDAARQHRVATPTHDALVAALPRPPGNE